MASFKSTRNLLLESFDDGVIDEDEFLLLYEAHLPRNPDFQYEHVQFNLDEMDDAECMAEFRCQKNDIKCLVKFSDCQKDLYAIRVQFVTASKGCA